MRSYICIDLKSFYASVECRERGLNPLTTNLVVADESRTDKTICLAVTPALKERGVPGRPRLFECEWHNKNTHFYRRKYPTLLCLKAFYRYTESVIKILRLRRDNDYAGGRYENNDSNVIQERV